MRFKVGEGIWLMLLYHQLEHLTSIFAFTERALLFSSAELIAAWLPIVYDYIPLPLPSHCPHGPLSPLFHVRLQPSCIYRAHGAGGIYSILEQASHKIYPVQLDRVLFFILRLHLDRSK